MRTRDRIITLHKRGFANIQIAQMVGVSRQRVWEVLRTKKNKQRNNKYTAVASISKKSHASPMSTSGVAAVLGLHPNTVRRWSDEGIIPCFRLGPRQDRRFEPQSIIKYHRNNAQRSA